MKIVKAFPPNIDEIRAALRPGPNTVYAYGDSIYSPSTDKLPPDLIAHESVHIEQQRRCGGPDAWWHRYLDDPAFRLEQELEAYRAQYQFFAMAGRAKRREMLGFFAGTLAGPLYGGIISKERARALVIA